MSCFNPNYMECFVDEYTGQLSYSFNGNARYQNPLTFGKFSDLAENGSYKFLVPCRHCLGCHIDYSRDWANRLCIELNDMKKAVYLTLTYNQENVPLTDDGVMTLSVRDTQLFLKRLRKRFSNVRIRYYLAGEYGPIGRRPHYHAIIFGFSLADLTDLRIVDYNELGQPLYTSDVISSVWDKGFITLGEVNYRTCAYVSRYVLKKHYSYNKSDLHGALPEFNTSSRRPGIGLLNYDKILDRDTDILSIYTGDDVHTFPLPHSFIRKGLTDENYVDKCQNISYNKRDKSNDRVCSDLLWTEKSYDDYLKDNYRELYNRIKLLKERR